MMIIISKYVSFFLYNIIGVEYETKRNKATIKIKKMNYFIKKKTHQSNKYNNMKQLTKWNC